jgi:hypothetical protein
MVMKPEREEEREVEERGMLRRRLHRLSHPPSTSLHISRKFKRYILKFNRAGLTLVAAASPPAF